MRILSVVLACVVLQFPSVMGQAGADGGTVDKKPRQSRFVWKRPGYVMPWLKGANVCAVEEVTRSRKKYYSECMTYMPRQICEKPTYIRYHCCTGFERVDKKANGCEGVAPIGHLMDTAKHLYLKDFRKFAQKSGMDSILNEQGAFTVFAPHNEAFTGLERSVKKRLATKNPDENLLLYHTVKDRYYSQDLKDGMQLPTLHDPNEILKVSRYSNGILCVNCARIILPNQPATNGIIHTIEKIVQPIGSQGNVMDILIRDGNFGEFVTGLVVTSLNNELRTEGPFTVFAPTDAAFRNAPKDIVARILNDRELTKKVLQYHILEEGICAAAIIGTTKLTTKEGQRVELSCDVRDRLMVNGKPSTQTDIVGTNGVIHIMDELLIPDSVKSLGEVVTDLKLDTFTGYAKDAGLWNTMERSKKSYTLFVPSEEAFAKLTAAQRRLLETSDQALKTVMEYHMVEGKVSSSQFVQNPALTTTASDVNGKVQVTVYQNKEFGVNNAKIVTSDHQAGNGVIHVIDTVMFPPEGVAIDKIHEESRLSMFFGLLRPAGMDELLLREGSYTIFAPTTDAIGELDSTFLEKLMLDSEALKQFLNYHMLDNTVYTAGIQPDLRYRFQTLAGEWLDVKKGGGDGEPILVNGEARIVESDVQAENGVIHVVDKVLDCPCLRKMRNTVPPI